MAPYGTSRSITSCRVVQNRPLQRKMALKVGRKRQRGDTMEVIQYVEYISREQTHESESSYLDKVASLSSSPETEAITSWPGSTRKAESLIMDRFHHWPNSCWLVNTQEHHKWENALVNMFIETGISTRLCDSIAFKTFCFTWAKIQITLCYTSK